MNLEIENIGRFQLHGEWAPELLEPMRELLRKYECLLPAWCQIAYVRYEPESGDELASCLSSPEYRKVNLTVGEGFFSRTPKERTEVFIHEIVHARLNTSHNAAYALLKDAIGDNELAWKFAERELTEAIEFSTCDMTALIVQLTTPTQRN